MTSATAKSGYLYENPLAQVKQLKEEHHKKLVSFTLSNRDFFKLEEDLKLNRSHKRNKISWHIN